MDYEQAGKLILAVVFLILLIALVIVRRGMKPEPHTDLSGATLHQLQDMHGTLREIAGYLKPAQVEIALHAKLTDPARRQEATAKDRGAKNTRKVRAGTGRS